MTRKNLVKFATVMMMAMVAMVCNAQGFSEADAAAMRGMDFEWDAEVVTAAPAAKTSARATRTVNVRQLASASNRRNSSTASRTRAYAQQTQTQQPQAQQLTPMQQQLQATATASQQQAIVTGTIEHIYNQGFGKARIKVRSSAMFGGVSYYTVIGYPDDNMMQPAVGDLICFIVTYGINGRDDFPIVNFSEMINSSWMQRYMLWYSEHYYGGNTMMMYSANPKMSKWNKVISGVMTGAYAAASVASVISLIKSIF